MDGVPFRRGRALLGFMTEQEALDFLRGNCVFDSEAEFKLQEEKWASASKAVMELQRSPLGSPERRPIQSQFGEYVEELSKQQAFKQTCGGKCELQQIEIENLIAFQRYVDTEYAADLASKMKSSEQFVVESCLPLRFQQNLDVTLDPALPGAVSFSSSSPKLIFSGRHVSGLGGPQVKIGEQVVEQPGVFLLVGAQPNYVQVTEFNSRFILKNGYHRAYAAILAGLKYLPAALLQVTDFAETGALNPSFFPKERLMSDKPPLIKDLSNGRLSSDVKLRAMRKVIRVRVDEFLVPR